MPGSTIGVLQTQDLAAVEGGGLPEIRHMPMATDEVAGGDQWLACPQPDRAHGRFADQDVGEVA